ncbi:MAG: hypothetical protein P4L53_12435 [Candidatus Obscuribacterales bacterium]|nr:hypothetical protein [Candidatus Obscuribacterales bacterium]
MVESDTSSLDINVKKYVAKQFSDTTHNEPSQQIDHALFNEWADHAMPSSNLRMTDTPAGRQLVGEQTFPDGSTRQDTYKVDSTEPLKTSTWDAKLTMSNGTVLEEKQEDGHSPIISTISLNASASKESMAFIQRPICDPGKGYDSFLVGESKPYYVSRGDQNSKDLLYVEKPYGEKKLPGCSTLPNVFTMHKVED